jgi:hypothetical protein
MPDAKLLQRGGCSLQESARPPRLIHANPAIESPHRPSRSDRETTMHIANNIMTNSSGVGGVLSRLFVVVLASMVLVTSGFAASKKSAELDELMSHDGLEKVKSKGLDLAYRRPGATLTGYNKVMLDPVEVAFHKDWDPQRTGSRMKLSSEDRENIRSGVSKLVYEEFVKQLQKDNAYPVVTQQGPDVLRVKASIINLYANAPDTMEPGRSRTYTVSAGEMTLVAELFDSETGEVLARVIDRRESRNTGMMQLSNSVVNASEARSVASSWARILRSRLDDAHGLDKK